MAVTAHSDPFSIFMRKVGYTGGLEHTLDRFRDLERLYLTNRDVTLASWKELVEGPRGWRLRSDNIGDVFYALRFIQRTTGDVLVLENLDAAAIAGSLLTDEEERGRARSFLLLWALLANDGELFVNSLLADFEETRIAETLSAMMAYKRDRLRQAMPGREAAARIARVVTVERQETNRGSAGGGRGVASLRRTEPLRESSIVRARLAAKRSSGFSDDYFRKVPPRRKDWARSLGLWMDKEGLTADGARFVRTLRTLGYVSDRGFFVFWPMDYELVRSGFAPNLLGEARTLWKVVADFAFAYAGVRVRESAETDADELVEVLCRMSHVHRSLHVRKAMLRRELSIVVTYPAVHAIAAGRHEAVMDWPKALRSEQKGAQRRVAFRRSRNTGGAFTVKL